MAAVFIEKHIKRGELFATFHASDVFLNHVVGPHRERVVGTPEYEITAVKVERE